MDTQAQAHLESLPHFERVGEPDADGCVWVRMRCWVLPEREDDVDGAYWVQVLFLAGSDEWRLERAEWCPAFEGPCRRCGSLLSWELCGNHEGPVRSATERQLAEITDLLEGDGYMEAIEESVWGYAFGPRDPGRKWGAVLIDRTEDAHA